MNKKQFDIIVNAVELNLFELIKLIQAIKDNVIQKQENNWMKIMSRNILNFGLNKLKKKK